MAAGRDEEAVAPVVVVAADARHDRKLLLDGIGVLGIGAGFALVAVEVEIALLQIRDPGRTVQQPLLVIVQMGLHAEDQRRPVGEVMVVHQIQRHGVLASVVIVQSEIGILAEMVVIGHEGEVRTHLVLLVGVVDGRSHGHADLEVGVGVAVADVRPVEGHFLIGLRPVPVVAHGVAHGRRVLVAEHAAETVLLHELPSPADLRAVVGGIEPLVRHVDLVREGQVAEPVVVVVHPAHVGVHRSVEQDDAREFLVLRHGECRREVHLGAQFVVEVEVQEEPLLVGGLAVFEVDLPGDGLMPGGDGGDALRDLDRVEPHAGRIAQPVGGAQSVHDRAVLVEDLGVGSGQPEHLDLPGSGDGVAVPDGHRRGVFERLGEVAAGHLAEAREGDHLALHDSVALDEVALEVALDDDILQRDAFGAEGEFETFGAGLDADRVVDITEVRRHETVIPPDAVEQESPFGIGACADGRAGPVDRGTDERLVVGIAHHAAQVLGTGASEPQQDGAERHHTMQFFHEMFGFVSPAKITHRNCNPIAKAHGGIRRFSSLSGRRDNVP